MCGSPLPGSQLQLSTGSLDFAVTIIMIVGKNCPAVHCNLVKDLGNIWRWVQNTDFTECCGSCAVWRHLLRELYKQNLTCASAFPSRLDSASTAGSRTRLLLLCGHPRAQSGTVLLRSLAYCSSWLLLRMGSRNEPRQACIKLGKQVSAGMWQAAQPGFWHPKWVLEPAVLELVAAPG